MTQAQATRQHFGTLPSGEPADLFTLVNGRGAQGQITNYGGILVSLRVPDRTGELGEVVLGYDNLPQYIAHNKPYFGALIGRYANRIGHARFSLKGIEYRLAANDGRHHLHGGMHGFDKQLWRATCEVGPSGPMVQLSYLSEAGEEGYPGELDIAVTYTLTEDT